MEYDRNDDCLCATEGLRASGPTAKAPVEQKCDHGVQEQ